MILKELLSGNQSIYCKGGYYAIDFILVFSYLTGCN